ncbi:MAG TPA: TraR/DksA C4-type zinc finger protein [Chthoniobacterales bacterium]|nr:TraR/DksA C4-type zinc finger protein [Chthoniobacterales bacterium]
MASKKPAKAAQKPAASKSSAKTAKPAPAKPATVKKVAANKAPAKKTAPKAVAPKEKAAAKPAPVSPSLSSRNSVFQAPPKNANRVATKLTPFLEKQRERLLILKDTLLDSMNGVARDSLRSQTGGDASAFGMHQADAGSDAYDRDFALSLLSQEQDSLYEIDQALKRIDDGTYGVCEVSGKQIMKARLEALPFTRYTVECQAEIEKRNRYQRNRQPVTSLFGLTDDESDGDDEETVTDSKDKD